MKGFTPGLLDRLMDERGEPGGASQRLTIEQIKDHVARDLEALLNTRAALPPDAFDEFPLARASILNYGLLDFAGFCMTSDEDRARDLRRPDVRHRNPRAAPEGRQRHASNWQRAASTGSTSSSTRGSS